MDHTFTRLNWKSGRIFTHSEDLHISVHTLLQDAQPFTTRSGSSYIFFMLAGKAFLQHYTLEGENVSYPVTKYTYGTLPHDNNWPAAPHNTIIYPNKGCQMVIIERPQVELDFSIRGPVNRSGRFSMHGGSGACPGYTSPLITTEMDTNAPMLHFYRFLRDGFAKDYRPDPAPWFYYKQAAIGIVMAGTGRFVSPFGDQELQAGDLFCVQPKTERMRAGIGGKFPTGLHDFRAADDHDLELVIFEPGSPGTNYLPNRYKFTE